jgi:hypothetical protein
MNDSYLCECKLNTVAKKKVLDIFQRICNRDKFTKNKKYLVIFIKYLIIGKNN